MKAENPANEKERLQKLKSLYLLDTSPEQFYDDITELASKICGAPIALISLIDSDRQWFKSKVGMDEDETSREVSFCAHALLQEEPLIVENALNDARFSDNPYVASTPKIRFYAGFPLRVDKEFCLGTLCVADHVIRILTSDQKSALERLARIVEHQIAMRNAALKSIGTTDNALDQVKQQAEFCANLSHEIRNQINGMMGLVSILTNGPLDDDQKSSIRQLNQCNDHLLRLVNDTMDLSKVEAGELEIEMIPFDLHQEIRDTLHLASFKAKEKNLKIQLNLDPDLPRYLKSDPMRIRQVLLNIIGNSVKFTEKGRITVRVSGVVLKDDLVELRFSIQDTGIGMSKENLNRIFVPFRQADSSISRKYGGTGLGLVICKKICELMGGKIEVESTANVGSIFRFSCSALLVNPREIDHKTETSPTGSISTGSLRILVAEDCQINQRIAQAYLEKLGYKADIVSNGTQVLTAIEKTDYDIIFMDVHMPELNGLDATRRIRSSDISRKKIPFIVAMTANALKLDADICISVGMNTHMCKPFSVGSFSMAIEEFLRKRQTIQQN